MSRWTFAKFWANSGKIIHIQPPSEQSFLLDTGEIKKFPDFRFRQIIKWLLKQPNSIRPDFPSNRLRHPSDKKPLNRDKKDKENNLKFCLSKRAKFRKNNLHKFAWKHCCNNSWRIAFQN